MNKLNRSYIINKINQISKNDLNLANTAISFILIMGSALFAMLLVFVLKWIFELTN